MHHTTSRKVAEPLLIYEKEANTFLKQWGKRNNLAGGHGNEIGLDLHGLVDFMQSRTGDRGCSFTAGLHDVFDAGWMLSQFRACIPDRRQLFHYPIGHEFLAIDTADRGGSAVLIDLVLNCL